MILISFDGSRAGCSPVKGSVPYVALLFSHLVEKVTKGREGLSFMLHEVILGV